MEDTLKAVLSNERDTNELLDSWIVSCRRGESLVDTALCHPSLFALLIDAAPSNQDSAKRLLSILAEDTTARKAILQAQPSYYTSQAPLPHRQIYSEIAIKEFLFTIEAPCLEVTKLFLGFLHDEDTSVSERAVSCLTHAMRRHNGPHTMSSKPATEVILTEVKELLQRKDAVTVRVMEGLLAGVVRAEEKDGFEFLKSNGVMDLLVDSVEEATTDVLLLMNYLEVLELLSRSPHGVQFMTTRRGLGARLAGLAQQNMIESVSGFALRFIANFCAHSSENALYAIEQGWVSVAKTFCVDLRNDSLSLRALQVLSGVGQSAAGLEHLISSLDYKILVGATNSRQPDVIESGMHGLAEIFERGDQSEGLIKIMEKDYSLQRLFESRSSGLKGVRIGCLRLISALAGCRAAGNIIADDQFLWDWLVDPDIEPDLECKDVKYGAAQKLALHAEHISKSAEEVMELRVVAKMGPLFSKRAHEAPESHVG